jgi:hypothetical protein
MRIQLTALLLGLAFVGYAGSQVSAKEQKTGLGELRSFEVHQFEKYDFSSSREMVPPEIVQYARTAIQNDERFTYRSPGAGIVHFYCDGPLCGRIRMEVTQGQDGPVVWKASRQYRPLLGFIQPDGRKFAKKLVKDLAADYESAIKEIPVTIPIKD